MDAITNKITSTLDTIPIIADSIGLEYDTDDGKILFTKKEVDYYDHLFYILDNDEDGYINRTEIEIFLQKAKVKPKDFEKMHEFVNVEGDGKDDFDKFEFFVFLKLVAFYQLNGNKVTFDDVYDNKAPPLPEIGLMSIGPDTVELPEGEQSTFLRIDIDKPHEIGSFFNKRTVYTVKTKTIYKHFNGTNFKVDRRYNDFVWLHTRLSQRFPQIMIPPLPEKKFSGRFDKDFIETRRLGLQSFANEISNHKDLSSSFDVFVFLTSTDNGLEHGQKVMPPLENKSVFKTFGTLAMNLADNVTKTLTGKELQTDNSEFAHIEKHLEGQRNMLSRYYQAISGSINYYKLQAKQFNTLNGLFNQVLEVIRKREDKPTKELYDYMMSTYGELDIAHDNYAERLREVYLTPVGFIQNKTKSVSGLILNRARAQQHLKEAETDREKKFNELTNARSKGRDKVAVARENLDKSKTKLKECKKVVDEVLVGLHENFVKFHEEKMVDLHKSLIAYVNTQNEFNTTQISQCDRLIEGLGFTKEEIEAQEKLVSETHLPPPTLKVLGGKKKKGKKEKHSKKDKKSKKKHVSESESESEEEEEEETDDFSDEETESESEDSYDRKKGKKGAKGGKDKGKGGKGKKEAPKKQGGKHRKEEYSDDDDSDNNDVDDESEDEKPTRKKGKQSAKPAKDKGTKDKHATKHKKGKRDESSSESDYNV